VRGRWGVLERWVLRRCEGGAGGGGGGGGGGGSSSSNLAASSSGGGGGGGSSRMIFSRRTKCNKKTMALHLLKTSENVTTRAKANASFAQRGDE